jgi:hypothetical protein
MAHFARLNDTQHVIDVIVIDNRNAGGESLEESEQSGLAYLRQIGLLGVWKQTSYNGTFRARYAGIGYTYDDQADVFYPPQPYASWTLDESWNWQAPTPYPTDGGMYTWDENTLTWTEVEQ